MNPILSRRTRVRSSSESAARSWLSMAMDPLLGRSSPPIRFKSVDFPDPDGPTIATRSPGSTARSTSSSAFAFRFPSNTLGNTRQRNHRQRGSFRAWRECVRPSHRVLPEPAGSCSMVRIADGNCLRQNAETHADEHGKTSWPAASPSASNRFTPSHWTTPLRNACASRCATRNIWAPVSGSRPERKLECWLGITSMCPGLIGRISRNAVHTSSLYTQLDGI